MHAILALGSMWMVSRVSWRDSKLPALLLWAFTKAKLVQLGTSSSPVTNKGFHRKEQQVGWGWGWGWGMGGGGGELNQAPPTFVSQPIPRMDVHWQAPHMRLQLAHLAGLAGLCNIPCWEGELNRVKNRPALAQQPDVYLEPKWLRYLLLLPMLGGKNL